MKIFRAIAAIAFFAAMISPIVAQQPRPGQTPPGPTTSAAIPDSKIALIDSGAFADEKQGIVRLINAVKRVNAEFQPRKTELETLNQQIEKATADLTKVAPMQSAQINQQQQEKIDQMKKDLQRKAEDAQTAFDKRMQGELDPISKDISTALDAYARAHGITLVLDVAKFQGIVSAADSLDITKAFILEFNAKNPATAALNPK
jgi:Skp family chaperone for outer membrane proteins